MPIKRPKVNIPPQVPYTRPKTSSFGGLNLKPITIEAPKIDSTGLLTAYDWFAVDKVIAFKLAFEWYAKNTPLLLFGDPLDDQRQKTLDRGIKSKALGDGSNIMEERTHAYTTAIHLYEKVWPNKDLPLLDANLNRTDVGQHVTDTLKVLDTLNQFYSDYSVKFRVTYNDDRELQSGEVLLPKKEVDLMIPMTPIQILIRESTTVAKAASIVTVEGTQTLDGSKFMSTLPEIMQKIAEWSAKEGIGNAIGSAPKPIDIPNIRAKQLPKPAPVQAPPPPPKSRPVKWTRTAAIMEKLYELAGQANLTVSQMASRVNVNILCTDADILFASKGGSSNPKETMFHLRYVLGVLENLKP